MFTERQDLGTRIAGEKGHLADEFLTRSQVIEGTNITIERLGAPTWDIRINATSGSGGNIIMTDAGAIITPRMLAADILIKHKPGSGTCLNHTSIKDGGIFYGTTKYIDIVHNWNLPGETFGKTAVSGNIINHYDKFQYSIIDLTTYGGSYPHKTNPYSFPKVVGIDPNTVRVWCTDTHTYGIITDYITNQTNWVLDSTEGLINGELTYETSSVDLVGFPKFRIVLEEVL